MMTLRRYRVADAEPLAAVSDAWPAEGAPLQIGTGDAPARLDTLWLTLDQVDGAAAVELQITTDAAGGPVLVPSTASRDLHPHQDDATEASVAVHLGVIVPPGSPVYVWVRTDAGTARLAGVRLSLEA